MSSETPAVSVDSIDIYRHAESDQCWEHVEFWPQDDGTLTVDAYYDSGYASIRYQLTVDQVAALKAALS